MDLIGFVGNFVHSIFFFFQNTEVFGLSLATWMLGFVLLSMIIAMVRGSR